MWKKIGNMLPKPRIKHYVKFVNQQPQRDFSTKIALIHPLIVVLKGRLIGDYFL